MSELRGRPTEDMLRVGLIVWSGGSEVSGKHPSWASAAVWSWGCSKGCRHYMASTPAGVRALCGTAPSPGIFPHLCLPDTTSPFLGLALTQHSPGPLW